MAVTALSGQRWQGSSTGVLNTILTFTGSGTFTPTEVFDVDYLVIGGGAGTGTSNGGGGGAGAFRESDVTPSDSTITVATEEYTITVGAGSVGVSSGDASHGSASSINSSTLSIITADGGGAGGRGGQDAPTYSGNGSGGGSGNGASGTDGGTYGNNGGDSANNDAGGGAGASGNGDNSNGGGGDGGDGSSSSITGSSVTYCGGGGGSAQDGSLGTGGSGGGGNGTTSGAGADATGYGSGGGGGAGGKGGNGSDGVVILSFDASKTGYSTTGTVATTTTTQDEKTTVTDVPVGSQFEQTNDRKFYQLGTAYLGNTNDDDGANFDASDSLNDIIGDKITSGNSLIGKTITKISLKLYRVATGTATETLTFGIWDFATGDLKGTDFGTIQVDTIATSSTEYTLTHSGSGVELAENDIIGIRCDYEDATPTSHQIKVRQKDDPSSYANGGRIIFTQGDDNPSNFDEDKDIYFKAHFKDWVERGTAI